MNLDRASLRLRILTSSTLLLFPAALAITSCNNSSPTEPAMTGGPPANATLVLSSSGVSIHSLTVAPGSALTITNNDAVAHEFASNPHPTHTQCPELNGPVLQPGNSFTARMASMPETCGYHDHLDPTNVAFQGTIIVSN